MVIHILRKGFIKLSGKIYISLLKYESICTVRVVCTHLQGQVVFNCIAIRHSSWAMPVAVAQTRA
jgi:hypothetical protein